MLFRLAWYYVNGWCHSIHHNIVWFLVILVWDCIQWVKLTGHPRGHNTLNRCWFTAGSSSTTLDQHYYVLCLLGWTWSTVHTDWYLMVMGTTEARSSMLYIDSDDTCNRSRLYDIYTQQAEDVESMLVHRWSSVYDAEPTLNQHWFNIFCLLDMLYMWYG